MHKQLTPFSAVFLVVASMLGTGILTTTGIIVSLVKTPTAAIAVWILGGVLALIGAWCYGELARRMPRNGGEATILRELYTPALGELAGWTSFVVAFSAGNAATSLALADYLQQAWPGLALPPLVVACVALSVVTALHGVLGALGLRIQTALAATKFILLASLALYGVLLAVAPSGAVATAPQPALRQIAEFGAPWGLAMMLVMFAYSGWNAAIYVAGDIREPLRNVRRAMMTGAVVVMVLYVTINAVLLTQLPVDAVDGVVPVVALLVKQLFGTQAAAVFSGLVAFALLSSLGVSAFLGPRVLAALLGWSGRSTDDHSASTTALSRLVWLQGGLSVFMVLSGSFVQILTVMGFLLGLFPILCVLGLYRDESGPSAGASLTLTRCVLAPVFAAVSTVILVLGAQQSPGEVAIALALIGLFFLARAGVRRFASI